MLGRSGLAYLPLLMIAVSAPLALGMIEPNGFYGFRTASSLASDAAWYRANSAGGLVMLVCSAIGLSANYWLEPKMAGPRSV